MLFLHVTVTILAWSFALSRGDSFHGILVFEPTACTRNRFPDFFSHARIHEQLCNSALNFFLCSHTELVCPWSCRKRRVTAWAGVYQGWSWAWDLWVRCLGVWAGWRKPFLSCALCATLPAPRTRITCQAPCLCLVTWPWNRREALTLHPWQKNRASGWGWFRAGFAWCARHATSAGQSFKTKLCSLSQVFYKKRHKFYFSIHIALV